MRKREATFFPASAAVVSGSWASMASNDLLSDAVNGIEGVHGGLEDHRDAAPANFADFFFGQGQKILAIEEDLSADEACVVG